MTGISSTMLASVASSGSSKRLCPSAESKEPARIWCSTAATDIHGWLYLERTHHFAHRSCQGNVDQVRRLAKAWL